MKKYFIIICTFFYYIISSQIIISNKINNKPIPNVTALSIKGQILGVSDKEGKINNSTIEKEFKISDADTIELNHTNFEKQRVTWKELKSKSIFLLEPVVNIDEVVISAKNPKYLVLKSYFISYQLIDNTPQSFSDGIIEYYILLSKNKIVNYNILETRIYKNIPFINEFYRKIGNTTLSIGSQILPFNFNEEVLLNRWNDFEINQNNEIKLKNEMIGHIENNKNNSNIFIEYFTPLRIRKQSLLGMSSQIANYNVSESFSSTTPLIKNIQTISKYYESFITQKKNNFKYELIQNVQILEKKFLTKEDFEKRKINFNHSEKTKYINNYWEQERLISIPSSVNNILNSQLELLR